MSSLWFPRVLSLGVGFLSLSQEILLVRLVSFAYNGTPKAFAFVLAFFLVGVAVGAHIGKQLCRTSKSLYGAAAIALALAALLDTLIPFVIDKVLWRVGALVLLALMIAYAAALKSVVFPIAHHLGSASRGPNVGSSVSKVYFANIIGSTLGPVVTGFVLLDHFSLAQCLLFIATGSACLAMLCAVIAKANPIAATAGVIGLLTTVLIWSPPPLIENMIRAGDQALTIRRVVENRSGIIHTIRSQDGDDATYGGNVYDGRINTDLRVNSNGINRAYLLAALHPAPRRVLIVGLSSGAWAWVVSSIPGVDTIDVVEINPGYLTVINDYPQLSSLLHDARITHHIDDARRWLRRHPEARYDLIVMNTTFHWRAYATNLLSIEFLEILKSHLAAQGVVAYNATGSPDVYETAGRAFSFVRKYDSFVYASDHDFLAGLTSGKLRIWTMSHDGSRLLDPDVASDRIAVAKLFAVPFQTVGQLERGSKRPLQVISDDNLLTEYKYGLPYFLIPQLD